MLNLPWPLFSKEGNKTISPFEKGGLGGFKNLRYINGNNSKGVCISFGLNHLAVSFAIQPGPPSGEIGEWNRS
jgi:hypothetical protein